MTVVIDTEDGEIRATRPIRSSGNSSVVSFPPELLQQAGLEAGDEVELTVGFEECDIKIRKTTTTPQSDE